MKKTKTKIAVIAVPVFLRSNIDKNTDGKSDVSLKEVIDH
jgi:hypothetical protein